LETPDNWRQVEAEYEKVVTALNDQAVSATIRSAEGVALYRGIDSHNANGGMRQLAEAGHEGLLRRIREMAQPGKVDQQGKLDENAEKG
jgi:hypothetical protein